MAAATAAAGSPLAASTGSAVAASLAPASTPSRVIAFVAFVAFVALLELPSRQLCSSAAWYGSPAVVTQYEMAIACIAMNTAAMAVRRAGWFW